MTCPSFDDLLSWRVEPAQGPIGSHVDAGCPDCRRRLDMVAQMFDSLQRPAPPVVPAALRASTLQQLDTLRAQSRPDLLKTLGQAIGRFQEFVAELVDLPRSPALAVGLRGEADAGLRRYSAGPWRLDVGLIERRALMGQLLDTADDDAVALSGAACILCGGDGTRETEVDADGAFRFESVGPGRYGLMIETDDQRLLFPDVDLALPGA